jgi:Protein of unknown function (DUF1553)/Protein of unknown function (DUF1549)/Planctomycete cytochrome C
MRARLIGCLLFAVPLVAQAGELADQATFERFEKKVRPLLASRCWQCHGAEKSKGGLRLDSAEAVARGGETGPAIVAGKPEQSLLVKAVCYQDELKMPPKGKLSDAEVAELTEWVRAGAVWPGVEPQRPTGAPSRPAGISSGSGSDSFWSFQAPSDPIPPGVEKVGWSKSPIDRFILSGLERKGLDPAPPAEKRALIRRASFDLTGIPPSPEEVDAFLADQSEEAFERVVDRLLASPRYGERWGRHWLDLARYADSNGMDENVAYANAFRYRDYVVKSFNADKPYDMFLKEQLAGDLLPPSGSEGVDRDRLIATGFLVIGPKMLAEDDPVKMEMDIIDEQVDTVGRVFMGLTIGCARCHDHKFDPIPTADYYGLAGIFKSTRSMKNHSVVAMWNEHSMSSKAELAALEAHRSEVARRKAEIKSRVDRASASLLIENRSRLADYLVAGWKWDRSRRLRKSLGTDANSKSDRQALAELAAEGALNPRLIERWADVLTRAKGDSGSIFQGWDDQTRDAEEKARRTQEAFEAAAKADLWAWIDDPILYAYRQILDDPGGPFGLPEKPEVFFPPGVARELRNAREGLARFEKSSPPTTDAMGVEEQKSTNLRVHIRGSHLTLGEEVARRFPGVLSGGSTTPIDTTTSGRLELAGWLTRPDHPLTARVMVNRIWLGHFGEGLLRSPDNFGHLGDRPDHPELLDWLARRFVESGWSMKAMHRLIMLSSTYRMSTRHDARATLADPENRLLWHFARRRLEAEAIRDAILSVSGELDPAMGGTLLPTKNHAYVNNTGLGGGLNYDVNRRSVYLPVIRSGLYDVFQAFDFADPSASNGKRIPTTVAPQALFMMNDRLVLRCSEAMGRRLLARPDLDDRGRVHLAYSTAYGRPPLETEIDRASKYLRRFEGELEAQGSEAEARRRMSWQALCQAIFASSEFLYID